MTCVYDTYGNEICVCDSCLDEHYAYCEVCGEYRWHDDVYEFDGTSLCGDCADELTIACNDCGEIHLREKMTVTDGVSRCRECQKEFEKQNKEDKENEKE